MVFYICAKQTIVEEHTTESGTSTLSKIKGYPRADLPAGRGSVYALDIYDNNGNILRRDVHPYYSRLGSNLLHLVPAAAAFGAAAYLANKGYGAAGWLLFMVSGTCVFAGAANTTDISEHNKPFNQLLEKRGFNYRL